MTHNNPPRTQQPATPHVPASEPEQERQAFNAVVDEITSEGRITVFTIDALEAFLNGSGLTVNNNGFITVTKTGEYAQPYAFNRNAFTTHDGVSDQHLLDYFDPTHDVRDYIRTHDKLHVTDVHGFVPGREDTPHQYPVPDDTITISQYNRCTGCTLPAVSAWSALWRNAWSDHEDAFTGNNFVVKHPLTHDKPELTCLRCSYTGNVETWDTIPRSDEHGFGFGELQYCPECNCQWDTNTVYTCSECNDEFTSEEIEYVGEGVHVEAFCPDCDTGPIREQRRDWYDT